MRLSLVVAMTPDRVIGRDGGMPWHLPADLAHFKRVTMGHPVIMGRRTRDSIGRALPGRRNIVVSRNDTLRYEDAELAASLEEALALCDGDDEVMIIGGGQLYSEALARADRIHRTVIEADIDGDTHFPDLDPAQWRILSSERREPDERNRHALRFEVLVRHGEGGA
jgi:dihydrofolate reductase